MTASTHPVPGGAAWLSEQERDLVGFASGAVVPEGFGWLDAKGGVEPERATAAWITSRMTHVFSLAHLRGVPDAADLADHGLAALAGPLRDAELGGWFEEVPEGGDPKRIRERSQALPGKAAYPHSFVVLACASAAHAGRPGARALLEEARTTKECG